MIRENGERVCEKGRVGEEWQENIRDTWKNAILML